MSSLLRQRFDVFVPIFGNATADLVAVCPNRGVVRIEVKSSAYRRSETAGWEVKVDRHMQRRTNGKRMSNPFKARESDVLALYLTVPGRVLYLSSAELDGRTSISVFDDPELYALPAPWT